MKRVAVQSSNLVSIGYDEKSKTLEVEFKDSGVYQYIGVPASVHKTLMAAESKGKYLNSEIKPNYEPRKL